MKLRPTLWEFALTWATGIVAMFVLCCTIWGVYIILSFFFPVMVSV